MPKRIVLCTDGTWDNTANDTNVYKVWNSLITSADQVGFYDDGVGANGTVIEKLIGGAFGAGLFQKVKDGYTKIAQLYEQDDPIFLFGFSRGAYTARSIAGMIAICGLPTKNFDANLIETAFQAYRNPDQRPALLAQLNQNYDMYNAKITMLGVWDTVGSLGIPALLGGVDHLIYGFLDTGLHPDVLNAYQALAIDERRVEFPPTLWTSLPASGQTIEQTWFSGVHSDVGGSYSDDPSTNTALSDITLSWMMNRAWALGLETDPAFKAKYLLLDAKNALDTLHDSWTLLWGFPRPRSIAANAWLSNSVVIRRQNDQTYRPGNLSFSNDTPAGTPAPGYTIVPVVAAIPNQSAQAAGGANHS
jgi:uncharacterized protein (DUF2235 family)